MPNLSVDVPKRASQNICYSTIVTQPFTDNFSNDTLYSSVESNYKLRCMLFLPNVAYGAHQAFESHRVWKNSPDR
jgi:hypothetical protein